MERRPASTGPAVTPAQLAKGALRRLATQRLEPTPANFARAYAEESGEPPAAVEPAASAAAAPAADAKAQSEQWAALIDRVVRGLDRGGRQWTGARKKESLQRVLSSSRSDAQRLQQRLGQLMSAWESDRPDEEIDTVDAGAAAPAAAPEAAAPPARPPDAPPDAPREAAGMAAAVTSQHPRIIDALEGALRSGLPPDEPRALTLADELAVLARRIAVEGASAELAEATAALCLRVQRLFGHRHLMVDELLALCRSLTEGLTELAEDGSWAQGQARSLYQRLDGAAGARAVHAARELLELTRERQRELRGERERARDALKTTIQHLLAELGELDTATGRFNDQLAGYVEVIAAADSLENLAGVVREMVGESRAVHTLVADARQRMASEHARAGELQSRVLALEADLRRLSDEVSTDALTQVANRRGLATVFEAESARVERAGPDAAPLAVGLIDIDNFKKLNDSLGHAAGDVALKALALRVKASLRPVDHIARFGGEEFVVLLPGTPVDEAQQVLTRLQRSLSASLFMHDGREVFVTFSAGVTAWRPGEAIEAALERADEGLYEAKRSGKNRTCIG
jgi:diguanylate cyclase